MPTIPFESELSLAVSALERTGWHLCPGFGIQGTLHTAGEDPQGTMHRLAGHPGLQERQSRMSREVLWGGVGLDQGLLPFPRRASGLRIAGMMRLGLETEYQAREATDVPVNVTPAGWTHLNLGVVQLLALTTLLHVSR